MSTPELKPPSPGQPWLIPPIAPQYKAARDELVAAIDTNGNPTGSYWMIQGLQAARQTRAVETIRAIMLAFTVLFVIGVIVELVVALKG